MSNSEAIDIDAKVTRLETPAEPERDIAQALVLKVMFKRDEWVKAWHSRLIDPKKAQVQDIDHTKVDGCWPGSAIIVLEERIIARFIVRYREHLEDVEFEIDLPREELDPEAAIGDISTARHRVVYETVAADRVDFACDDLNIEGTAASVEEMKHQLVAKYGFRFDFAPV